MYDTSNSPRFIELSSSAQDNRQILNQTQKIALSPMVNSIKLAVPISLSNMYIVRGYNFVSTAGLTMSTVEVVILSQCFIDVC